MSQNVKLYFLNRNKGPSLGLLTLLRTTLTLLGTPLSLVGMPLTHSGIPNHPPWNARILTRIPLSCTIPPSIHNMSHMDPNALQGRIQDSKRGLDLLETYSPTQAERGGVGQYVYEIPIFLMDVMHQDISGIYMSPKPLDCPANITCINCVLNLAIILPKM